MSAVTDETPEAPPTPVKESPRTRVPALDEGTKVGSIQAVTYATESLPQARARKPATVDPIATANRAIVALTEDQPESKVERSNLFDDWKEALMRAAETGLVRSAYQRQVVGMLLAAIRQKDEVDFSREQLLAFRSLTNIARGNPLQLDVNRAVRELTRHGLLRPLGLSPDGISEAEEEDLDKAIATFIRGSR